MLLRTRLNLRFIWTCLRKGIAPWNYFQLNAQYFNEEKGFFSKIELEHEIPPQWKLKSVALSGDSKNWLQLIERELSFPLFIKPEWGQNSYGIFRAKNPEELTKVLEQVKQLELPYIVQEAAKPGLEFEVFYIRCPENTQGAGVFSITESLSYTGESLPINGVNFGSYYRDRTHDFCPQESQKIMDHCLSIGDFKIARVGLKAQSKDDLVAGRFQIFEINVFTPMPLNLLDDSQSKKQHLLFLKHMADTLSEVVAKIPAGPRKNIFWKKTKMHFKVKKLNPVLNPSTS